MFDARIIADSVSRLDSGEYRLTTFQLCYPRFIHAELMTHRQFSRNAMSSRAVPVAKMIEQVRENPAEPVHWGKNQPGMQAAVELEGEEREEAIGHWHIAAAQAADTAERMNELGVHKQVVNRILEPFQWMHTIVTLTEWDNFESLRCHPAAEPNFQKLAYMMQERRKLSTPRQLHPGQWHLPYVSMVELEMYGIDVAVKLSAARCARVSYLNHDGTNPVVEKDVELYERLVGSKPMHASPVEHQATPDRLSVYDGWYHRDLQGNLVGWIQNRKLVERGRSPSELVL